MIVRKNIHFNLLLSTIIVFLYSCLGAMDTAKSIQNFNDPLENMIRELKYIPFKVFHEEPYLGYITDLQNTENPVKRIWSGELKKSSVKQTIKLKYSYEQAAGLKARIPFIVSLEGKISKNEHIEIQLVGLEKYFLVNPKLEKEYAEVSAYQRRPYIDSMLRAEKIVVKVVDASGAALSAEADITKLFGMEPGAGYSYDEELQGVIAAEKAIIGYTLRTPEFEDIMSVTSQGLIFSVLGWKQGISNEWQPLDGKSYLRSGDLYKLVLKAENSYYLYIFNIDAQEKIYTLFPLPGGEYENPVAAGKMVSIPTGRDEGFILDDNTGTEMIEMYVSRKENKKLKELCEYINQHRGRVTVAQARLKLQEAADDYARISEGDKELERVLDFARNKGKDNYAVYNAHKLPDAGEGIYYSFTFHHIAK